MVTVHAQELVAEFVSPKGTAFLADRVLVCGDFFR